MRRPFSNMPLLIEVGFKDTFRGAHGEDAQIKFLIGDGDVVLKNHILFKFGEDNILAVFFSLNLVADVVVDSLAGDFPRVAGCLDFCLNGYI